MPQKLFKAGAVW